MAGVLFGGSQLNRNSRVAMGGRLGDLIAFARFLPKDAVANTLRFLVGGAAPLHVALQGGTAPPPLRLDRPLVLYVLQLQVVHLVRTALPKIQLCSFCLHCSLLCFVGFCILRSGALLRKKTNAVPGRGRRLSVRAVKAAGQAFIGAKRRALTEDADGSGAGLGQEGQKQEGKIFVAIRQERHFVGGGEVG